MVKCSMLLAADYSVLFTILYYGGMYIMKNVIIVILTKSMTEIGEMRCRIGD